MFGQFVILFLLDFLVASQQVLSSYINPGGTAWDHSIGTRGAAAAAAASMDHDGDDNMDQLQNIFPPVFVELLSHSCLIPAISSYLRNDSGK